MANQGDKQAVTVRIGGEDHTIRANVEPEYTERCAKLVDDRIAEIRSQLGLIESHKAAILAALSITDELFQARLELEEFQASVAERTQGLALRLEESLAEMAGEEGEAG
jgi:cell division protein ZapA